MHGYELKDVTGP